MDTVLYHYTDSAGKDGIYSSGKIESRQPGDGLAKGVYFTEVLPPPSTKREDIIYNNFGTKNVSRGQAGKVRFWFKLKLSELPAGTRKLSNIRRRNVWYCPSDVPVKKKNILYHYTDEKGRDAIYATGIVKAMRPHRAQGLGANMPIGVYFTQLAPDSDKEELLFNMFGTRDTSNKELVDKTRFWFKYFEDELPGVYKRQNMKNRNEWVCPQDVAVKRHLIKSRDGQ